MYAIDCLKTSTIRYSQSAGLAVGDPAGSYVTVIQQVLAVIPHRFRQSRWEDEDDVKRKPNQTGSCPLSSRRHALVGVHTAASGGIFFPRSLV
jgi:hypothetical protein